MLIIYSQFYYILHYILLNYSIITVSIIAEGICSDDIFGIHTELKLPPQKNNLGLADDDNTELESVSGMFQFYLHITTVI